MKKKVIIVSVCILLIVVVGVVGQMGYNIYITANSHGSQNTDGRSDLIIDHIIRNVQSIVYEIPDDDGRADTVRYIGEFNDKLHSKLKMDLEIIDATKLDDSTLKDKLKGGFILYTTIGSRLFNAATQPLHIQIDGGTFRWNGVTAPVSDLRIILVGKNPYGNGHCVVYAAGSNRLLTGINYVQNGPCSYHIFQGDKFKLLKEGYYNGNFVVKGDSIPQAEAVADVHQFFETLQRVHPDLLAKVDLKDYIKLKQQTLDVIAKKLDKDGMISVNDLAYQLCYAAAFFQDAHTSVQWDSQPNRLDTRFPPFLLGYDNGRFVVRASSNKSMEGLEVLSVNGKPVREFLRPILDRCSAETLAFKAMRFTNKQAFWYCFSNLCGSAESLTLKLQDVQGKQSEQKVETVGLADFRELKDNNLERLRQQVMQGTQVHFLDSDRTAYFVYPAFNYSEDERKKIDSIFQEIKDKKSQDLIIDLRDNGGGNSNMGDFIFRYLREDKISQNSKMRIKVSSDILSPSYTKLLEEFVGSDVAGRYSGYLKKKYAGLEGMIVTKYGDDEDESGVFPDFGKDEPVSKPKALFSGRVFLLVDNGSFSGASMFAATFRDYNVGKILGYETGGVPISFGDIFLFNLKNSGIPCGVSWKQFFNAKPRPGDDEHGVIPDIPMNAKLLRPYQKEDDPVLAFTLDHIKKTR